MSVHDQMTLAYMDLTDLLKTDKNPKKHDLPALRASMLRWGFTQPLAIDERTGKLVEGHGRIEVLHEMKKAGGKPPARVEARNGGKAWFVPVVRGLSFASDLEAEAYLIAANQLTTAGGWDDQMLGSMMQELKAANVSFDGLGFQPQTLDRMLASFAPAGQQLADLPQQPVPSFAAPAAGESFLSITPAAAVTSDGQFSPPPTSMPILEEGQTAADVGVLDPTQRIESEHAPKVMRTILIGRHHIPCSAEESAALDSFVTKWMDKTGSLYGFFTAHLCQPADDS
jgi:hypothetical protein